MAIDPQFMQALQMIGQAGQQFAIGQQMNEINSRAQSIRDSIMPDMEKRQAMQELAQMASMSVAGSGGSQTQLGSIQNLMPQTPNSAVQAILQGSLNGDNLMVQVGQDILKREDEREVRKYELQLKKQLQAQAHQDGLLQERELRKITAKDLGDIKKLSNGAEQSLQKVNRAISLIEKNKNNPLAGTGPLDQFILGATDQGTLIRQSLQDLRLDKIMEFAQSAGARSIDTAAEQRSINEALASAGNYETANITLLRRQAESLKSIISKARASEEAFKVSGGRTLDAAALGLSPQAPTVSSGKYRPQAAQSNVTNYFTPKQGR